MAIEMKVPSPGESITEVQIARWIKKDGDYVEKDEEVCEIDSDKATLTLPAEASGVLKILVKEGEMVPVGSVVCSIDESAIRPQSTDNSQQSTAKTAKPATVREKPVAAAIEPQVYSERIPGPAAGKLMREKNISGEQIVPSGKGGRITKGDVESLTPSRSLSGPSPKGKGGNPMAGERNVRREKMSMLRKKVAQRLVAVKQETAMLTTFNEVDMSAIMNIRKQYKDKFKETHGVNLGFMSFFTKAVCEAMKSFPAVNAQIDGDEIVYHDYCDIGIAVSAPKGLMVPVIRNAESLSLAGIEMQVLDLGTKARDGKVSIEEMTGGTFTITNGGVFGSMLSTPIINPPQSAILGMHNIVERPVAINGKVEIRPIMYVALSYDHRIIDGRESVGFLVKVKQMLEEPIQLLLAGNDPVRQLLDL
ncbi:MAG: 2-oxoglutarate dehydrogenase complex dihydrolipoyllysine-residue succinyltransferase [Bacteroidetes bacterium]|nr:2-oxoglutarate dehydrogenase complex dihydrolipoyllysine-residue succinyltransferase [Bacteroidota bacterium]